MDRRTCITPMLFILPLLFLAACSPSSRTISQPPTSTPIPPAPLTQTAQDLHDHAGALRFMTFNVQHGGLAVGSDPPVWERLEKIIEVIKAFNPDVIGLQETNGWDWEDPTVVEQVAYEMGMNYAYCHSEHSGPFGEDSYDTAILTRHEIVDFEAYSQVAFCLLRAEIDIPGVQWNVQFFTTHVAFDDKLRCNEPEIRKVAEITAQYTQDLAVLGGDFNISAPYGDEAIPMEVCYDLLEDAGWQVVIQNEIDIIYFSGSMLEYAFEGMSSADNHTLVSVDERREAADHEPVVVDIFFDGDE